MSDKKITKFQIGAGANAQIVEVSNNEEALETLRTELNATIEALQTRISEMSSKITALEERMNSICCYTSNLEYCLKCVCSCTKMRNCTKELKAVSLLWKTWYCY